MLGLLEGVIRTGFMEGREMEVRGVGERMQRLEERRESGDLEELETVGDMAAEAEFRGREKLEGKSELLGGECERNPFEQKIIFNKKGYNYVQRQKAKKNGTAVADAGKKWFHLKATKMTPELDAHLRVLHYRDMLDEKRQNYTARNKQYVAPKFFEVGTEVYHAADRYAKPSNKQLGQTLVQQVLKDKDTRDKLAAKYRRLAERRTRFGNIKTNKAQLLQHKAEKRRKRLHLQ